MSLLDRMNFSFLSCSEICVDVNFTLCLGSVVWSINHLNLDLMYRSGEETRGRGIKTSEQYIRAFPKSFFCTVYNIYDIFPTNVLSLSRKKKSKLKIVPTTTTSTTSTVPMVWASPQTKITHLRRESSLLRLFFLKKNKNLGHPEFLLGGSGQF